MFGSGYNNCRARGIHLASVAKEKEAWGEELLPMPEGRDINEFNISGEFCKNLYNSVMTESGAAEKISEMRREVAIKIASLPQIRKSLTFSSSDSYMRDHEEEENLLVLKEISVADAELVVFKKAQHDEMRDFWKELYQAIKELTGVELSLYFEQDAVNS